LRFVEGDPDFSGTAQAAPANALSKLWIGDRIPRRIDMLSLMAMSDAFFGRVFAVADARIFHKSYGDQTGELWSPKGRLLATTHQIAYFKA
jgi:hypothetical protein